MDADELGWCLDSENVFEYIVQGVFRDEIGTDGSRRDRGIARRLLVILLACVRTCTRGIEAVLVTI